MGVLVLNAGYEPLQTVPRKRAVLLVLRNKAVIDQIDPDGPLYGQFSCPKVVRLTTYVDMRWRWKRPPRWSRQRVLIRDGHRCAYCEGPANTVDHIRPLSKGGGNTWLNTVACCGGNPRSCNARKGNRLLENTGMTLKITPRVPTWIELQPNDTTWQAA